LSEVGNVTRREEAESSDQPGPLEQVRRAGETWRFAREELRELPPHALHALAAREHLRTTAELVERLADEVAAADAAPPPS
jgi:hypothetical protein